LSAAPKGKIAGKNRENASRYVSVSVSEFCYETRKIFIHKTNSPVAFKPSCHLILFY
jgi:hypothetical protein